MEIKTTSEIHTESCVYVATDMKKFDELDEKKWVAVDDLLKHLDNNSKYPDNSIIFGLKERLIQSRSGGQDNG